MLNKFLLFPSENNGLVPSGFFESVLFSFLFFFCFFLVLPVKPGLGLENPP